MVQMIPSSTKATAANSSKANKKRGYRINPSTLHITVFSFRIVSLRLIKGSMATLTQRNMKIPPLSRPSLAFFCRLILLLLLCPVLLERRPKYHIPRNHSGHDGAGDEGERKPHLDPLFSARGFPSPSIFFLWSAEERGE